MNTKISIVLHQPEIPGNTGAIGRTCLALNYSLILIHPLGFQLDEKSVRRAGLDYWKHVDLKEYYSWEEFLSQEKIIRNDSLFLFSKNPSQSLYDSKQIFLQDKDESNHLYLIFGAETRGLPSQFFESYPQRFFQIPMESQYVRSLNLANAASVVAYECYRQLYQAP